MKARELNHSHIGEKVSLTYQYFIVDHAEPSGLSPREVYVEGYLTMITFKKNGDVGLRITRGGDITLDPDDELEVLS